MSVRHFIFKKNETNLRNMRNFKLVKAASLLKPVFIFFCQIIWRTCMSVMILSVMSPYQHGTPWAEDVFINSFLKLYSRLQWQVLMKGTPNIIFEQLNLWFSIKTLLIKRKILMFYYIKWWTFFNMMYM